MNRHRTQIMTGKCKLSPPLQIQLSKNAINEQIYTQKQRSCQYHRPGTLCPSLPQSTSCPSIPVSIDPWLYVGNSASTNGFQIALSSTQLITNHSEFDLSILTVDMPVSTYSAITNQCTHTLTITNINRANSELRIETHPAVSLL